MLHFHFLRIIKMKRSKIISISIGLAFLSVGIIWFCNIYIKNNSKPFLFDAVETIPSSKAALLPGTSQKLKSGNSNPYFDFRIESAVQLFFSGKVKYIIVSGDNRTTNYNEPADMKRALMLRGIPKESIFTDYAGLRTFDSVVRCREIFGQDSIIVVSQRFQNERAVFIAQHKGIYALGLNAKDVSFGFGVRVQLRELLARVVVFTDLFIFNTNPKHLGQPVQVK